MLHWIVDHATLFYVLLGLVAAACAAAWWLTRKKGPLIALGVVVGLMLLIFILSLFIVTDRQMLAAAIHEMASAVEENKPEKIVKHLARDFTYGSETKKTAAKYIKRVIDGYGLTYVKAWDIDVEKVSREEGKAQVSFRTRVDWGNGDGTGMFICRCQFILEEGAWRLKSFQIFNPVVNTDQPLQIDPP
jgi:hypothetical protein